MQKIGTHKSKIKSPSTFKMSGSKLNKPNKLSFNGAKANWEDTSMWLESVLTYAETSTGDRSASKSVDLVRKIMIGYLDHGWLVHTKEKLEQATTVQELKEN